MSVHGHCDAAFAPVRKVMEELLSSGTETGLAVCVMQRGKVVLDLWGGHTDETKGQEWKEDTMVNVFSTGKGVTTLLAGVMVDKGYLSFDTPVEELWPEYCQNGKEGTLFRHFLTHRSGSAALDKIPPPGAAFDWDTFVHLLEESAACWEPGSKQGYHALTFGHLVGEMLIRAYHRRHPDRERPTFSALLDEFLAGPLGCSSQIFAGVPESEMARVASLTPIDPTKLDPNVVNDPLFPFVGSLLNPSSFTNKSIYGTMPEFSDPQVPNSVAWRKSCMPAAAIHTHARALARLYSPFANGGVDVGDGNTSESVVSLETLEAMSTIQTDSDSDATLVFPASFGMGFMLRSLFNFGVPYEEHLTAFGHNGMGGSLAFADPAHGLSCAYVMNRMNGFGGSHSCPARIVQSVYDSLKTVE